MTDRACYRLFLGSALVLALAMLAAFAVASDPTMLEDAAPAPVDRTERPAVCLEGTYAACMSCVNQQVYMEPEDRDDAEDACFHVHCGLSEPNQGQGDPSCPGWYCENGKLGPGC